jgi:hypothetical protein
MKLKLHSHHNRGIASIIGGVFLILIILSAYAFFVMSNQATNDLQSTIRAMNSADDDKKQENIVLSNVIHKDTYLKINISNQGPNLINIIYIGTLNEEKPNDYYNYTKVNLSISPGDFNILKVSVANETGKYQIKAISENGNVFTATYPFVSQSSTSISLIPSTDRTSVIISGSGFTSDSPISIAFDQSIILIYSTDASGLFSTTFTVPLSALPGAHNVKVTDSNLFFASATFTIT